ncbi:GAF domain-containing protein [Streptomyces sp. NPDC059720]|uniref:GAF domain-containing protein n=1 Tax=Streptomyces sp. NPDC059720 TaxID=3346924 RepID=UPI0036C29BFC
MAWLRKYWLKLLLLTLASFLAAGAFVASVVAGDEHSAHRDTALWTGATLALMVVLVTASETALNERERTKAREEASRTAAQVRLWYNHVLLQMSKPLGKLAEEHAAAYNATGATPPAGLVTTRTTESTTMRRSALVGAATLTARLDAAGLPTARSAYYRLVNRAQHEFDLEDWAGRPVAPRAKIDGAAGSHFVHDILDARSAYHAGAATGLVSKVNQASTDYRSVIAVPVMAGAEEFGVLTVDAPKDTDLTVDHVRVVQGLADLLAAALALT